MSLVGSSQQRSVAWGGYGVFVQRIPWRFRTRTNFLNHYTNLIFRRTLKTRPMTCSQTSNVTFCTLLCHRDVCIGILAIKSFLRFYDNVRVLIQDDGSLTARDMSVLRHHLRNVTILERRAADSALQTRISRDLAQLRAADVTFLKVVDVNVLCPGKKLVADSDVLFLRSPDEVIAWIENPQARPFYHQQLIAWGNKPFERRLPEICATLGTNIDTVTDFNSGFLGLPESLRLEDIEATSRVLADISKAWGLEQNIYAFLLKPNADKLDARYYQAVFEDADEQTMQGIRMMHFLSKMQHKNYRKYCRQVISDLGG